MANNSKFIRILIGNLCIITAGLPIGLLFSLRDSDKLWIIAICTALPAIILFSTGVLLLLL
jgi:hypothetical protein